MANANAFPLVRGRKMRLTKTDGCCGPAYGDSNSVVTEGFVSIALTANITEAEEITVTKANGQTCVRDIGSPTFDGYGVEITFCEVQPCVFSLITGQPVVLDENGNVIGFKMNSGIVLDQQGFALEVWMGVPGVACEGGSGSYGYLLLPCLKGGVIGDFTIENAAITFTITGAATSDGNGWGTGPYADSTLLTPLDDDDHLYVVYTTNPPPDDTDGCVTLAPIGLTVELDDPDVTVNIPRGGGGCWDNEVTVDWGDGSAVNVVTAPTPTTTHSYAADGTFDITISASGCPTLTFPVVITNSGAFLAPTPQQSGKKATRSAGAAVNELDEAHTADDTD